MHLSILSTNLSILHDLYFTDINLTEENVQCHKRTGRNHELTEFLASQILKFSQVYIVQELKDLQTNLSFDLSQL
jgi:hypothetical protein